MSKKLLLADDSITIQKVIGITFASEDVALAISDNGDAALEMARAERPDLILADVLMPGKNGYELCEAVKTDPRFSAVPVLLLTGTFEPFDEDKARACGADAWIAKPFESQALIDKVQELLALAPEQLARPAAAGSADAVPLSREEAAEPLDQGQDETAAAAEGIWGDFSFEEEDIAAEDKVEAVGAAGVVAAAAPPEPEEDEDDILELDAADILEEDEELEPLDKEIAGSGFEQVAAPLAEEPDHSDWLADADEDEAVSAARDADPVFAVPSPDPVFAPETEVTPEPEWAPEPEPAPAVAETAAGPATAAAAAQLRDEDVAAIVEKVAAEVVNRLAGSILEKIAWEVVPDLAESLIQDEIRKIKDALK